MKHALAALLALAVAVPVWAAEPAKITSEQLDKAFKDLLTFKVGSDASGLTTIQAAVTRGAKDEPVRADLEKRMIAVLAGEATPDAKDMVCRQLFIMGSEASAPALAKLLTDERLSHIARYALEKIPGEAASQALRDALAAAADDKLRIGLVSSLSRRGDTKSQDAFLAAAKSQTPELAGVALTALSRLDTDQAAAAVLAGYASAAPKVKALAADACLTVAARYLAANQADKALPIYEKLFGPAEPLAARAAALQGLVSAAGEKGASVLLKAMTDADVKMQAAALSALRSSTSIPTAALAEELPKLPAAVQPQVILALGDRGDAAARPVVLQALKSTDEAVRLAAVQALGTVGCPKCVPTLAAIIVSKDKAADVARASLVRLSAEGVQAAIVELLQKGSPETQVEMANVLSARNATDAAPALIESAGGASEPVRRASLAALRRLAGPKDAPALVKFLLKGLEGAEADDAEAAALAVLRRIPDESAQAAPVLAGWPQAQNANAKRSLLRLLCKLGGKDALAVVKQAAGDADKTVLDAGVRALVDWPDAQPIQDVLTLAQCAPDATHKVLAFRGFVRMIALADASEKEMIEMYAKAMALAAKPEEKKMVLAALTGLATEDAMKMALDCQKDPALAADAKAAAEKIDKAMKQPARCMASNPNDVEKAVDGNPGTRWTSGGAQQGGEWFMLDLGRVRSVQKVILDARQSSGDYPRGYEVFVSNSKTQTGKCVAKGEGRGAMTEITFPAKIGRYVKIVQTGKADGLFWSIHEIKVE